MKIVKAQKRIAKLKGEIARLKTRASECVSTMEGNDYQEDFKELTEIIDSKIDELVDLKSRVMKENIEKGMFSKIALVGELKSKIEFYKALNIQSGALPRHYGEGDDRYISQISIAERNKAVEDLQEDIEKITEQLDDFNAETSIEGVS